MGKPIGVTRTRERLAGIIGLPCAPSRGIEADPQASLGCLRDFVQGSC